MALKYHHNIFQNTPYQGLKKNTKIGIFGLKIYHLATRQPLANLRTNPQIGYIIIKYI
jgi:hypothetical protein